MTPRFLFLQKLKERLRLRLELRVTQNRTIMLNLLDRGPGWARLSVHQMFLSAPDEVLDAIAHYVKGTRKNRRYYSGVLKRYIYENTEKRDLSAQIDHQALNPQGEVYNLKEFYDEMNRRYFDSALELAINWNGIKEQKVSILGKYHPEFKLIEIHRSLDDLFYPEKYVTFVVYHEMLHSVIPSYVDENGQCRHHGPEFKKREREYAYYREMKAWEKSALKRALLNQKRS